MNYGAIPTSSAPPPPGEDDTSALAFLSRAKARGGEALATRRPWKEMVHLQAFSLPYGFPDAYARLRTNLSYFTMNYAIVVLVVVFLSLLWHPLSLIAFLVMMLAWLFLYFLRDVPLVVFGRTITDKVVLIVLSIVTLVVLLLTGAISNILGSLAVGIAAVVLHAVFRRTDDLCLDDGREPDGIW